MALYAHPFKPAVELVKLGRHRQLGSACFFPVTDDQVQYKFFFPFDKRITQQRHQIIGNRAVKCVLEVQYARTAFCQHQVADDKVAVDIHFRLRQQGRQQRIDGLLPQLALLEGQLAAQFFGHKPFGEQVNLAQHDFAVVFRQFAGLAGLLQFDQFVDGFEQQGFVGGFAVFLIHGSQECGITQIVQHHKAQRFIHMKHLRHIDHVKQFLHFQIRRNTHLLRRRVHTDNGLAV